MRITNLIAATAAAIVLGLGAPQAAPFTVKVEQPGVTHSTATFSSGPFVNTFAQAATPNYSATIGGDTVTMTYSGGSVVDANKFGGADGTGDKFMTTTGNAVDRSYTLNLTTSNSSGINYFGYWLSALDAGNSLKIFSGGLGGTELFTFNPADVISAIAGNPAYKGNPTNGFSGQNLNESYVFVNFYAPTGVTFDTIQFIQTGAGSGQYESDNHTVGFFTAQNVELPEPATMVLFGAGLLGLGLARRRR